MLGYARIPKTLLRFGFTGNTVPPKGELIKFHSVVRPTLPGASVAPITAMLLGVKNTSRGCSRFLGTFFPVSVIGLLVAPDGFIAFPSE
jgi:hypothetical protein